LNGQSGSLRPLNEVQPLSEASQAPHAMRGRAPRAELVDRHPGRNVARLVHESVRRDLS
jgi:hypothetical protein